MSSASSTREDRSRRRWRRFNRRANLAGLLLWFVFLVSAANVLPPGTGLTDPILFIPISAAAVAVPVLLVILLYRPRPSGSDVLLVPAFDINDLHLWSLTELRGGTLRVTTTSCSHASRRRAIDLTGCEFVLLTDSFKRCYLDAYRDDALVAAFFVAANPAKVARALDAGTPPRI